MTKTHETFVKEVYALVGEEYYVIGKYTKAKTRLKIKHEVCSKTYMGLPNDFLNGHRCPSCGIKRRGDARRKTHEVFCREVCDLGYGDYLVLGKYTGKNKKILLKHIVCGYEYETVAGNFIDGCRCPKCNSSKGETLIENFLKENRIKYVQQFRYKDCRNIFPFPFDFYLPTFNLCIEYQGEQHYKPVKRFGGSSRFKKVIENDRKKERYCLDNNIRLLIIPYWKYKNIKEILQETLCL